MVSEPVIELGGRVRILSGPYAHLEGVTTWAPANADRVGVRLNGYLFDLVFERRLVAPVEE